MRDLYIKNGQGFLLVFSLTSENSLRELDALRSEIIRIKEDENVPMVMVGNKFDLDESRMVYRTSIRKRQATWAIPYYNTSAKRRTMVVFLLSPLVHFGFRHRCRSFVAALARCPGGQPHSFLGHVTDAKLVQRTWMTRFSTSPGRCCRGPTLWRIQARGSPLLLGSTKTNHLEGGRRDGGTQLSASFYEYLLCV